MFHLLTLRLLLVGMAKRQTFRHVTHWQGTAGLTVVLEQDNVDLYSGHQNIE